MKTIDLNADVGEGAPHDAGLIPLVTSANIACGGHAGDESIMEAAARTAIEHGVAIGAHPGHEDHEHFGRRELPITPDELRALLERQVDRLHRIVVGLGGEVRYLKLHGALYHQAGRDKELAEAVIDFRDSYHTPLTLLGQASTALHHAATRNDVSFHAEAFPDRAYEADGSLTPRSQPGAVLIDPVAIAAQAVQLAERNDSLCLHGDCEQAIANAKAVRAALQRAGYPLRAFTA